MNTEFIERIQKELDKKVVGEEKLRVQILLHLMKVLVKNRESTSGALVNGKSNSGKSFVTKAVFNFLPWSDKNTKVKTHYLTRVTPKAIGYYMADLCKGGVIPSLDNHIFYLEDVTQNVLDSSELKVLLSEGVNELVTIKQKSVRIKAEGVPLLIMTSAKAVLIKEMENRLSIIKTNASEELTERITERYLDQMENGKKEYDKGIRTELAGLDRVKVIVPFKKEILNLPMSKSGNLALRRDIPRFVDYIKASAALHQKNREKDTKGYIIATKEDLNMAIYIYNDRTTITVKEEEVLSVIKKNSGLTAKELVEHTTEIGLTRIHQVLNSLSDKGFIERNQAEGGSTWAINVLLSLND